MWKEIFCLLVLVWSGFEMLNCVENTFLLEIKCYFCLGSWLKSCCLFFFLKSFLLLLIKHTGCKVKLSNQTNLEIFLAIVFCGRLARRSVVLLLWQWKHWALYTAERRLLHRAVPCLLKRRWEVWTLWSFGSIVLWKKVLNLFCWFSTTDNSQSDEVRHVFFLETLIMFYICLKMC